MRSAELIGIGSRAMYAGDASQSKPPKGAKTTTQVPMQEAVEEIANHQEIAKKNDHRPKNRQRMIEPVIASMNPKKTLSNERLRVRRDKART